MRKILWNILWLIGVPTLKFFVHFSWRNQDFVRALRGPLIVAANHSSWTDPFLISGALPFNSPLFPIRYAVWIRFFYIPLINMAIWLLGGFPIQKGMGLERALSTPIAILKKGGVVGIFPEGRRQKEFEAPNRGRRGAAFLALKSGAPILPIAISGSAGLNPLKFFLRKTFITVAFGEPFFIESGNLASEDALNQNTAIIMEKIKRLLTNTDLKIKKINEVTN